MKNNLRSHGTYEKASLLENIFILKYSALREQFGCVLSKTV